MKTITVAAGIIIQDNKILCTQRDISKNQAVSLKWEFPGGKLEIGETAEQALKREIKEELDLDISIERFYTSVEYDYPLFHLEMKTFICSTKSTDIKLLVHKDYKWLPVTELKSLEWAPADLPIIDKLISEME